MEKLLRVIFLRRYVISAIFLHQLPDAKDLFEVVGKEQGILPSIIEKDYWLMHCLWGLQKQGFQFELKGGTSLSKGFGIINRFSEDIDIKIHPTSSDNVKIGKNHDKPAHVKSRQQFFDALSMKLKITGLDFCRDISFDDNGFRNAGIRGNYVSHFTSIPSLKDGILLELGFDQTTPNVPCDITSWAFEKIKSFNVSVIDNRAKMIACYCPEYTFVEKLQAISTKYRLQQEIDSMPINFLRHYYDIYQLLKYDRVLNFIGTEPYYEHKKKRFRQCDEKDIKNNAAFSINNEKVRKLYSNEFKKKSAIYFDAIPTFEKILEQIEKYIHLL